MKSNQVKQFGRLRTFRMRVLNANYTIAPVNNWDRTVCASDIKKFLECEALYLQWKEGDATGAQSLTEQVGDIVHEETAKPEAQRLNDLASRITTVTDKVERERVVAEVKKMIEVSTAAQKADSKGATVSKKEETMVYFDNYTNTWWYAKLDSTDLTSNDRGTYLNVIDQKAGRYRSAMQLTSVFFQAYVAKMSKAFGHEGPIRYAVRYLRDRWGNILNTPEEKPYWLGRRLNESQDQALYGTQVTIQKMDKAWATGEFRAESGNRCKTCQFAKSCPAGLKWQAEQDALAEESMAEVAAKLVQVNTAEVAANDTIAAPAALVHAHASNGTQSGAMHAA
ncbi:MAG: PD-(D/E)XK nuclease family protein [Candidatus Obscuribacterales bacterium]|jgi:hypothetical protein